MKKAKVIGDSSDDEDVKPPQKSTPTPPKTSVEKPKEVKHEVKIETKPIAKPIPKEEPVIEKKPIPEPSKIEPPKAKIESSEAIIEPVKPKVEPSKPKVEPPKPTITPPKPQVEPIKSKIEPPKAAPPAPSAVKKKAGVLGDSSDSDTETPVVEKPKINSKSFAICCFIIDFCIEQKIGDSSDDEAPTNNARNDIKAHPVISEPAKVEVC